jgi:hypothetical protein
VAGYLMGRQPADIVASKPDTALLGPVVAADAVQQAGLAGPVGPDDGEYLTFLYRETDPGQGLDAAEMEA